MLLWLGMWQAKLFQFLAKSPRSAVEMGCAKDEDNSDSDDDRDNSDDDDPAEDETC